MTVVSKVTITTFTYSSTSIDKGKTSSTPTVSITGTAKSGPTYSSSNTSIATVNSSGVVTGVSAGTATITVSYTNYDGSKSTKDCMVTIKSSLTYTGLGSVTPSGTVPSCVTDVTYKDLTSNFAYGELNCSSGGSSSGQIFMSFNEVIKSVTGYCAYGSSPSTAYNSSYDSTSFSKTTSATTNGNTGQYYGKYLLSNTHTGSYAYWGTRVTVTLVSGTTVKFSYITKNNGNTNELYSFSWN